MKKKLFLILCFLTIVLTVKAQTVWDFTTNMEGWHDLGSGRDVKASWENGSLKMTYFENSPGQGPQLWFAAVQVDNLNFAASNYKYLELNYQTNNWPTTSPNKMLVTLTTSDNKLIYSYVDIDPTKNFISIDIEANNPGWAQAYSGIIKSIQLELPHNGAAAANPATDWFSSSTLIDKVELTNTKTVPPSTNKVLTWDFDKNFTDSTGTLTGIANGNPIIVATAAKKGTGALVLGGSDYLTLPANKVFASDKITYTFWIKTPDSGQKDASIPSRILSSGNGKFELALYQGNLCLSNNGLWTNLATAWKNNVWQRVALVLDGTNVSCYINGLKTVDTFTSPAFDRSGDLTIGINGLSAVIDELSIYNYVLTDTEIAADGLVPPVTIAPWPFDKDLEGWHEIQDGTKRDVTLSWKDGAMVMTYLNKATTNGPQLWFPQVEVNATFDAALYPYCDIYYKTVGWPTNTIVKALLQFTKADGTIAYSYFDLNPADTFVHVDIAKTNPGWDGLYSGQIVSVLLELPYNESASPAEAWFGASTEITKIELNNSQPPINDRWNTTLTDASFTKSGLDRFNNPTFTYHTIGLGGTTMRVDPWGFAYKRAPKTDQNSFNNKPSFGYEYWWDNAGHRYNPFLINAGYGATLDPGTIRAFKQNLDIKTGVLKTDITLTVGTTTFTSSRETFITPDGILVIRVNDKGAPSPLKLNLAVNGSVDLLLGTLYAGAEEPFKRDAAHTSNRNAGAIGGVVTATKTNTSDCALAVAVDATSAVTVSTNSDIYSQSAANGTITFYIVPKASFNPLTPTNPWDHAWNAASAAKTTGYEGLKQQTANWWNNYLNMSKISVPDDKVSKLFAQSLYYHGIYFGNSAIPPGCFGTDTYGFFGAVCPEYDLTFSSFALAYTGHINETKNIAKWVSSVLPKCKENAVNGITSHSVFRKYDSGAIYTTLMGYDGAQGIPPEVFEGGNLECNYPGANAARMALNYLDYSDDQSFKSAAYDVLKSTTYVSLKDLISNNKGFYQDGKRPNSMQEGAVLMGFDQCVKRGIADPEWITKYQNKIVMSQGTLNGDTLLSGGVGANPSYGDGAATYFYPLWWATVIDKHDSRAIKAIENYKGTFQEYCFNNGWSGVHSAKVYRGDDALMWLKNFQRPDVLRDETSFSETATPEGINYTPEIGAHGAYICNLTQMLIDPDDDSIVDLFPAIPNQWQYQKVAYEGLMTTGALSFTAERDINGVKISITNKANTTRERKIRIKIPRFLDVIGSDQLTINDGFIEINVSILPGETKSYEYKFSPMASLSLNTVNSEFKSLFLVYPNPNSTGTLNITNRDKIDELLIYSLTGKMVKQFQNKEQNYDISGLETGIYIVQVRSENKYFARRLYVSK
jgi:hypothetical protein